MNCAWLTLSDLVRREGYTLIIDDKAADHPDALGTPQRDELCAQACAGNVIRMRSGLSERDAWYPVSHEIAEDRTDFSGHTQKLWREQLNILSRWCARLAVESRPATAPTNAAANALLGQPNWRAWTCDEWLAWEERRRIHTRWAARHGADQRRRFA